MPSESITTSARGVILQGQTYVDVNVCLPACRSEEEFLVQGVHVGPEIVIGATSLTAQYLPLWGVSVPVYQRYAGASVQVALTAISPGPQHVWATIPAGQSTGPLSGLLPVRVTLLSGGPATHRFEFNIHVTGICGTAFVCSQRRTLQRPSRAKRRK